MMLGTDARHKAGQLKSAAAPRGKPQSVLGGGKVGQLLIQPPRDVV
jgi:hypothetical protein